MKSHQKGFSMRIVLILCAVCVGIVFFVSKIQQKKNLNILVKQLSDLASTVSKNHKDVEKIVNNYGGDYLAFLDKTKQLPADLAYKNGEIKVAGNAIVKAHIDAKYNNVILFEVTKLDETACVKLATNNWGSRSSTQFAAVGIGVSPDFSCLFKKCEFDYISAFSDTSDYPMAEYRAEMPCSLFKKAKQPATIYLGYTI